MAERMRTMAENAKANITPKLAQAKVFGQEKAKQAKETYQKGMFGWVFGDDVTNQPTDGKVCICGSDIENRARNKLNILKWVIIGLIVVMVLFFILFVVYASKSKFSEPLFDFGIKQRGRYTQLDGLGSNDTYSQRMGYDKEFKPEYSS
jgi:hypothetical protein